MALNIAEWATPAVVAFACGCSLACGGSEPTGSPSSSSAGGSGSGGGATTTMTTGNGTTGTQTMSNTSNTNGTATTSGSGGVTSTSGSNTGGGGGSAGAGGAGGVGGSSGTSTTGTGGTSNPANPTYVYVGSGDFGSEPGMVSVYTLDRSTRSLSFLADYPAGGLASFLAIDTERGRLFSVDESGGGVQSFSVDRDTGMLTSLGATANSNQPVYLSVTGDGQYLLAANYNQGSVDVYPVDDTGKALASLGETASGEQAHCVVIDAQNRVFVANKGSGTIAHYSFASGTLTPTSVPTTAFESARHVFLEAGKAYAVSEEQDKLARFSVVSDGSLSLDWEQPRLENGSGTGADIQVTPSGDYLYATNRDPENSIVAYDVSGADPVYLGHESTRGDTPRNFAIDPAEELLIVANHGNTKSLVIFSIQADGTLQHEQTMSTDYSPFFVGIVQF